MILVWLNRGLPKYKVFLWGIEARPVGASSSVLALAELRASSMSSCEASGMMRSRIEPAINRCDFFNSASSEVIVKFFDTS